MSVSDHPNGFLEEILTNTSLKIMGNLKTFLLVTAAKCMYVEANVSTVLDSLKNILFPGRSDSHT